MVKPLAAHQELVVFYLPEGPARPEELFFVHMRSTLYRRTMDSILEGESGWPQLPGRSSRTRVQTCANISAPKMASSNCENSCWPKPTQVDQLARTSVHVINHFN